MSISKPVAAKTDQQQRLRDTLDDLKSRAAELEHEREKLRVAISSLEALLEPSVTEEKSAPASQGSTEPSVKDSGALTNLEPGSLKGKGQKEAAIQVLRLLQRPARLVEVIDIMKKAGYQFKAKKPYQSLYKALSHSNQVVKKGKYWQAVLRISKTPEGLKSFDQKYRY